MTKYCPRCGYTKSKKEFSKKTATKDGLQPYCKECNREYNQIWHMEPSTKIRRSEYIMKKQKEYRETNPTYRLAGNLRTRLYYVLKRDNIKKTQHTFDLVGLEPEEFKKYIEKRFKKGMSWANYGAWHIDHEKPCADFDLTKVSEQKKCFHYTNLKPEWGLDNMKKNKY
jgi:hypothetical protein